MSKSNFVGTATLLWIKNVATRELEIESEPS